MAYTIQPNERFRKINYYDTLLLTSEEFKVEQSYHSMVHQMHNQTFHGVGIAWGLGVNFAGTTITVEPGVALVRAPLRNEEHDDPAITLVDTTVMITKEVVVTEQVTLDMNDYSNIQAGTYYLTGKLSEIPVSVEAYKGDQPVHAAETMEFSFIQRVNGPSDVPETEVILGIAEISGTAVPYSTALSNLPDERKYSGLHVIESETHRLIISSVENEPNAAPAAIFEGDFVAGKGKLNIESASIDIKGIGGGPTETALDGNLTITNTANPASTGNLNVADAVTTGGDLTVGGNATINGDLTVNGTQTILNTTTMQVEDNVITLNRPVSDAQQNPQAPDQTVYAGLEVHPKSFGAPPGWTTAWPPAGATESWPALVWNHNDQLWKFFDYSGTEMDIGYGAPWDTLSKNHLADNLHVHSFLATHDPSDPNYVKALIVHSNGRVGIGTEAVPPDKLYVNGSSGITGNLSVGGALTVTDAVTLKSTVNIKGDLTIDTVLRSSKPQGLQVTNSVLSINHEGAGGNASVEVHRGVDPKAQILWDETDDVWKVSYEGIDTSSPDNIPFSPVEIATIKQLPKSLFIERTQNGHGFKAGDAIYFDSIDKIYKKAKSNNEMSTGTFIVISAPDVQSFTLAQAGFVIFREEVTIENSAGDLVTGLMPFTPGQYYYVSDASAGLLTEKEPIGISNPLFLADTGATGYVLPYRPSESSRDTLIEYIDNMIVGVVSPFAMEVAPAGWLECNGSTYNINEFPRLFSKIGITFGGDGQNTFQVPDLRGEFIRGFDNLRGLDQGRNFGTSQSDSIENHIHNFTGSPGVTDPGLGPQLLHKSVYANIGGTALTNIQAQDATYTINFTHSHSFVPEGAIGNPVTGRTANETRPTNVALLYCIKH